MKIVLYIYDAVVFYVLVLFVFTIVFSCYHFYGEIKLYIYIYRETESERDSYAALPSTGMGRDVACSDRRQRQFDQRPMIAAAAAVVEDMLVCIQQSVTVWVLAAALPR